LITGYGTGSDFYPHNGLTTSGVADIAFNQVSTVKNRESISQRGNMKNMGTDNMFFSAQKKFIHQVSAIEESTLSLSQRKTLSTVQAGRVSTKTRIITNPKN
jgi:hypothetical protein